jgi:AraC-like DNA-binding protein
MAGGAGDLEAVRSSRLPAAARLADFNRVSTVSVDDAASSIGRIFCPHDLKPAHQASPDFYALHNCAAFDGFSINYVSYGGSVSIDPGCLERFFLLQIPLRGSARVRTASCDITTGPGVAASLLSPTMPTQMTWESDCAQLILLVERRLVEQRAAALAGKPVGAIEFEPVIDLDASFGRTVQMQVTSLVDLAERLGPARGLPPVLAADLRESILGGLLNGQRHGLSDAIEIFSGTADALPRTLRRARDCLEAHAAEPLDLAHLADMSGIGIRALQIGFRRHFGTSISAMLLDVRLAQLNARLRQARPGERVVDIAFELGFTHLSRMASAYRVKFGESPSATLRKLS